MPFYSLLLILLCFFSNSLRGQSGDYPVFRNYDYIYQDNIKSVRFHLSDSKIDYPIIELGSPGYFIFSFDDLDAYTKDYSYKIIHCDAQWEPSEELDALDYIDGYQENRFYEAKNAFSTRVPYTHYEITLPNTDVKWTKSGNYLLKVYQDSEEEDLIITRRFMVVDTKMKIVPQLRRSATPPNSMSHQELFFKVQHVGVSIGNVQEQITPVVLQNGRWDNAITDLTPTYIQQEEIGFEQQMAVQFPGYKEFRPLDLRSFLYATIQVERIEQYKEGFELWLFEDVSRRYTSHVFTHDLNGKFFIESRDGRESKLQGEYGIIHFSLKATTPYAGKVYLLGGFNDFQPHPSFVMRYNKECLCYKLPTTLKNGFYDYYYGVVPEGGNALDIQMIEGSSYETENDYVFLVYYRSYGGLYDQLVAVQKHNTRPN
ncbi:MAG: DUF5103 domain-containing protein [Aureispira sp.]